MYQIMQSLSHGKVLLENMPAPQVREGHLLIQTRCSLISSGTERALLNFSKANLLGKIYQQPDKLKKFLSKMKREGLFSALDTANVNLQKALPMGYSNMGTVIAVGKNVVGFSVGDRVVSNGYHAEIVCVPKHLCAKVPDAVLDDAAVFTILGAIALQGVRLAKPTLGELFVVTGLGVVGQLVAQILIAHGCCVIGIDPDRSKLQIAQTYGVIPASIESDNDLFTIADKLSHGVGVDGVIVTASTTSSEPIHQAAEACRKRGRIILVGVTGLQLSRSDFYEKELSFQVSCSYGPGRYDSDYEDRGRDYPIGFVRWTEQRNFEAILTLMANGQLETDHLISKRFSFQEAEKAYQNLYEESSSLGLLLQYSEKDSAAISQGQKVVLNSHARSNVSGVARLGFIGAGGYAKGILIPAFKKAGAELYSISSLHGISGVEQGKRFCFREVTTDPEEIFSNPEIDGVVIASRHDTHSDFLLRAFQKNKHVFVEKPLCLNLSELNQIRLAVEKNPELKLMVGFNRRFSPLIEKMKTLLDSLSQPKTFIMTVNAGKIPADHWTQDLKVGGGRIIGEACHFVDLLRFLSGASIMGFQVSQIGGNVDLKDDKVTIILNFSDGSMGTIHYFSNGSDLFPKERLEAFCDNRILQLDDFRQLVGYGFKGFKKMKLRQQNKGQQACADKFVGALREGTSSPIPFDEIVEVSDTVIQISDQLER